MTTFIKLLIALGYMLFLPLSQAQSQPIVYGVFFYSPTCPHCHTVIDNHWPNIQAEFGEQLQVMFVNVASAQGSELMTTAITAMNIPSRGVPMLIIGDTVMIGAVDIPNRAPGIIRAGLADGGIQYPPIPDIAAYFAAFNLPVGVEIPDNGASSIQRGSFSDDPANIVAVVVLMGLIYVLGLTGLAGWRLFMRQDTRLLRTMDSMRGRWVLLLSALLGVGLSLSLLLGSSGDATPFIIALGVLVILSLLSMGLLRTQSVSQLSGTFIPLVLLAGLLVAGYLAYVETTLTDATCGVIGHCNVVQQSNYAYVFGVPIGIIGVVGYLVMMGAWAVGHLWDSRIAYTLLFVLALSGVAFSTYLTFLEPFVIGASCVWCLTSAVMMMLVVLLVAPLCQGRPVFYAA